jgi:hypothetical protein
LRCVGFGDVFVQVATKGIVLCESSRLLLISPSRQAPISSSFFKDNHS